MRSSERSKVHDLAECADAYLAEHAEGWRNDKHRQQWKTSLRTASAFGSFDVAIIDTAMVVKLVDPIRARAAETGDRLRSRVARQGS